jgi:hypothetical protein
MFKVINLLINASVLFFNKNLNFIQQNKLLPKVIKKDCNVQYKTIEEKCGEICVCSFASPYTIRFGGVKPGSCLDIGYKKYKYSEEVWIGPFGKTFIDIYTKR